MSPFNITSTHQVEHNDGDTFVFMAVLRCVRRKTSDPLKTVIKGSSRKRHLDKFSVPTRLYRTFYLVNVKEESLCLDISKEIIKILFTNQPYPKPDKES